MNQASNCLVCQKKLAIGAVELSCIVEDIWGRYAHEKFHRDLTTITGATCWPLKKQCNVTDNLQEKHEQITQHCMPEAHDCVTLQACGLALL